MDILIRVTFLHWRTLCDRKAWISSYIYGFSKPIEAFGVERYKNNIQKVCWYNLVLDVYMFHTRQHSLLVDACVDQLCHINIYNRGIYTFSIMELFSKDIYIIACLQILFSPFGSQRKGWNMSWKRFIHQRNYKQL